ncbi:hypothetical protein EGW08_017423 [Elysia chlorotica]|uniref:Uncharacterized protein n=1 Tax=Elysia chlorotica TaxID=188477 RepID=A0A3S1B4F0_ELYCH|nr:hypothetical protein EGW08_017423 [Elysia chlorotica]
MTNQSESFCILKEIKMRICLNAPQKQLQYTSLSPQLKFHEKKTLFESIQDSNTTYLIKAYHFNDVCLTMKLDFKFPDSLNIIHFFHWLASSIVMNFQSNFITCNLITSQEREGGAFLVWV